MLSNIVLGHKLNLKCHFQRSKKSSMEVLDQKEHFLRRNCFLLSAGPYKEWVALAVIAWFYGELVYNWIWSCFLYSSRYLKSSVF